MYKPTKEELGEVLRKHKLWLSGLADGECADLSDTDLRRADLSGADLSGADLRDAVLRDAVLSGADLSGANLCNANLHYADLRDADLSGADLRRANLRYADLRGAVLRDADLRRADLSGAVLSGADLSGAKGLLSSVNYMEANFERTADGYTVYKCFNGSYKAPPKWKIESGEVIEEEVNSNRTDSCGCGINVAPLEWVKKGYPECKIYKLLIKWEWLPGVVVPYNTDGKIRCERAMIIGVV